MKKPEVLIIGSGMGGLVCASLLCKLGYQVCVVERNKQLGGNLQIYVRNKVIFDSGVHYLGGLDKGQNLYQIFKWLSKLIPKIRAYTSCWRRHTAVWGEQRRRTRKCLLLGSWNKMRAQRKQNTPKR